MTEILHHLPEFIGNHYLLVMLLVALLFILISNEVSGLFRGYKSLTPGGLTQLVNRNDALLIDMSSKQDFDQGHIVGAKHVPQSQFDPESKDLLKVKELPVAMYCKTGQTSATAAARLVKAGFKNVYWLDGGLAAWRQADLPVVK